jgi:hypothetical protein
MSGDEIHRVLDKLKFIIYKLRNSKSGKGGGASLSVKYSTVGTTKGYGLDNGDNFSTKRFFFTRLLDPVSYQMGIGGSIPEGKEAKA